ncbi:MAG: EAL domain-containing protein [Chromatiales bacterium]
MSEERAVCSTAAAVEIDVSRGAADDEAGRVASKPTRASHQHHLPSTSPAGGERGEERFALLFAASPDIITVTTYPDGRFVEVNPAFESTFHCPRAKALGHTAVELRLLREPADYDRLLQDVRSTGQVINAELTLWRGDGRRVECLISCTLIHWDGQPALLSVIGDVTEHKRAEQALMETNAILRAISAAQTDSLADADPGQVFDGLLSDLLKLSGSEYGFIGEVLHDEQGQPYLRTYAITNIAWNAETRALYDRQMATGLEFRNLDNLFGAVITSGAVVIANDPSTDPRRGGLPPGHPALNHFMGLPIYHAGKLVGMTGVANRAGGYDERISSRLEVFLSTCGAIVEFYRNHRQRDQQEEALRVSAERYRQLVEHATEAIVVLDCDSGRFADVNSNAVRLFGCSREELLAVGPADLSPPLQPDGRPSAEAVIERIQAAVAGAIPVFEWVYRTAAGVDIVCEVRLLRLPVLGRTLVRGCVTDISERKQMERALLEKQATLAAAVRIAHLGTWEKDLLDLHEPSTNPLRWSDETCRIFGFKPGEIEVSSADFFRAVHPEDRQRVREADARAVREANHYTHSYRIVRPDGSIRHIHEQAEIIRDERTGRPLKIMGTARDVTELRRVEEQMRLAAQVFESSHEAILITDARRNVISVNRAFTAVTGYTAEEVIGRDACSLGADPDQGSVCDEIWMTASAAGHWEGELRARRKSGESYPQWLSITATHDETGRTENYIWVADDITERKAAQERIHYLAHYDALTDLPNRTLLRDRLSQALSAASRVHGSVAVLFLDLDRFKTINDSLGHHIGDRLLQGVAARLRGCVREMDTVARLGGDEFVLVLPGSAEEGAAHVAGKVLVAVSQPYQVGYQPLTVTPSIGISVYPQDGHDIDTLIRNADAALYHAKDLGRNNYQFFAHPLNAAAHERMSLENGLRLALDRQEFLLHYQPQIDSRSGRIAGIEALVRWQHPEWGLVSPSRVISVAEDTGLIIPLGRWILEEACRQNRAWQAAGAAAVPVAVNLSALQFRQRDFKDTVRQTLQVTNLEARYLELELTESIIMQDARTTIEDLNELTHLGVQISVDDFGTGYSSLSYLKRFPIDKLKIDQSFVRDVTTNRDDAAIVRALVTLAHSLGVAVIAEGVETREQHEFLAKEGCDQVQGYYFARPVTAEELTPLLRAGGAKIPLVPPAA